ncbi:hypothetical protein C0Q70_19443 [Pomacea canaliculata]|uniref:Glycine cleavage system H protein, mitochondrial n=1 Tax=Pomacea canaliculata TaxID=400727 RepID=A0A2T7NJC2_POMCA|nr:hypothetical protein C0Q70_19443 [Pomacea canaliculata]
MKGIGNRERLFRHVAVTFGTFNAGTTAAATNIHVAAQAVATIRLILREERGLLPCCLPQCSNPKCRCPAVQPSPVPAPQMPVPAVPSPAIMRDGPAEDRSPNISAGCLYVDQTTQLLSPEDAHHLEADVVQLALNRQNATQINMNGLNLMENLALLAYQIMHRTNLEKLFTYSYLRWEWRLRKMATEAGCLESVKAASDVYSPVAGKIVEVNEKLVTTPNLVNSSPLEDGWIFKLEVASRSDVEGLMNETAYKKFLETQK